MHQEIRTGFYGQLRRYPFGGMNGHPQARLVRFIKALFCQPYALWEYHPGADDSNQADEPQRVATSLHVRSSFHNCDLRAMVGRGLTLARNPATRAADFNPKNSCCSGVI
jgi:hypothetical protein